MLPTKFGVNWPFRSEEAKNRFSKWQPSSVSYQNNLSYFDLLVTQMLPIKFHTISLLFQEKKGKKIDFQDSSYDTHLGFPISFQEKTQKIDFHQSGFYIFRSGGHFIQWSRTI